MIARASDAHACIAQSDRCCRSTEDEFGVRVYTLGVGAATICHINSTRTHTRKQTDSYIAYVKADVDI